MNLTRFEPLSLFQQFQNEMNRIMEANPLFANTETASSTSQWIPRVDIKEDKESYRVLADVPGINPKDIEISLEQNVLTLKGRRDHQVKEEKENLVRVERSYGSFYRQFTLPTTIDSDQVSAKYNHGVLEIIIPKKELQKTRKIEIQ